jgi:hypothetical protein
MRMLILLFKEYYFFQYFYCFQYISKCNEKLPHQFLVVPHIMENNFELGHHIQSMYIEPKGIQGCLPRFSSQKLNGTRCINMP